MSKPSEGPMVFSVFIGREAKVWLRGTGLDSSLVSASALGGRQ